MARTKKPKVVKEKVDTHQEIRKGIEPQLCKVLNPKKFVWNKPWIVEPKYDGLRCFMVVEVIKGIRWIRPYSRNGRPLWNMGHICAEVAARAPEGQEMVLDGEVYTKDWNLSMGIVKSSVTVHEDALKLHYHIWDCLTGEEFRKTWTNKLGQLHYHHSDVSNLARKQERLCGFSGGTYVDVVPTRFVNNREELAAAYAEFLEQGYEGAILKDPNAGYWGDLRAPHWLKIKPWTDADLTVVGAYAGEGKHVGRIGGLVLEGSAEWDDKTYTVHTEVGTGFTDAERESFQRMWDAGTLIGRIVEIKFQDITVENACRFPVYHRLREDKE